ncbi:MAG: NADH-quinone oxidoreductase subunit M [Chthoniobacterales bacterium]|nr:NADH-quinone oxidoreductase subunit M [Chthoniobacterales bacterium]
MILLFLVFCPVVAAILILLGAPARTTALIASGFTLLAALGAFIGFQPARGFNYVTSFPISAVWRWNFSLGVDGLSLMMLLLTAIVTLAAVWFTSTTRHPEPAQTARDLKQGDGSSTTNESLSSADAKSLGALRHPRDDSFGTRAFYASLLFISAGALGAFASLDLFFFYAFHELALIPTFLLIGIWGSGDRYAAAWKITIYLATGSFILLLGLITLYRSVPEAARSFDLRALQAAASAGQIAPDAQRHIYLLLLIGFGTLISLFPFHTWAPQAYASAPAPAAMLHAGVLKKFGLYGLLRIAVPMLPEGQRHWAWLLIVLLLGNIIYVGLVTIAQKRLDWMLGYSSVMHMGYIFLGIASGNLLGTTGAAVLMFAHGLSIALLFAVAGQVRDRTGTLRLDELGGLGKIMPLASFAFGLGAFASIGLPGFANFAAEVMVFFGAFRNGVDFAGFHVYQVTTALALWGVVISAVYMLRAYRATFMGTMPDAVATAVDIRAGLRLPIALLVGALLWIGFFPQTLVRVLTPTFRSTLSGNE